MVPSVGDQTRPRPWGVDLMLLTALAQASSPTPLPPPNSQHVQLGTERLHLQPREAVNYFLLQETKQTLLLLFL